MNWALHPNLIYFIYRTQCSILKKSALFLKKSALYLTCECALIGTRSSRQGKKLSRALTLLRYRAGGSADTPVGSTTWCTRREVLVVRGAEFAEFRVCCKTLIVSTY